MRDEGIMSKKKATNLATMLINNGYDVRVNETYWGGWIVVGM